MQELLTHPYTRPASRRLAQLADSSALSQQSEGLTKEQMLLIPLLLPAGSSIEEQEELAGKLYMQLRTGDRTGLATLARARDSARQEALLSQPKGESYLGG